MRFSIICLSLLLCSEAAVNAAETEVPSSDAVRITNGEWPPYLSDQLPYDGLVSRIIREAFALEGVQVEYGFFPWARALHIAALGAWDATAVWRYSPERAKQFYFSDPVIIDENVFFHLKKLDLHWVTYKDLKEYKIGLTRGYYYGSAFRQAKESGILQIEELTSDEQNFRLLLAGRTQLFPVDRVAGYYMLSTLYPPQVASQFSHHPKPVVATPLHLLFSKKVPGNKILVARFNRGLKRLRDSGVIGNWKKELGIPTQ